MLYMHLHFKILLNTQDIVQTMVVKNQSENNRVFSQDVPSVKSTRNAKLK